MGNINIVGTSASLPQTGSGRTRAQITKEIAEHLGGGSQPETQAVAGRCLDDAVRYFNTWPWKFNRVTQDITLVAADFDYSLNSNFRSPWTAMLLDSNGKTRERVRWIPYTEWTRKYPDQSSTGGKPDFYTALNVHETGLILIDPVPAATITYPTLRLIYHRRIVLPTGDSVKLNVPVEIENAIFSEAVARYVAKRKTFREARDERLIARADRIDLEHEYRDFPDSVRY